MFHLQPWHWVSLWGQVALLAPFLGGLILQWVACPVPPSPPVRVCVGSMVSGKAVPAIAPDTPGTEGRKLLLAEPAPALCDWWRPSEYRATVACNTLCMEGRQEAGASAWIMDLRPQGVVLDLK